MDVDGLREGLISESLCYCMDSAVFCECLSLYYKRIKVIENSCRSEMLISFMRRLLSAHFGDRRAAKSKEIVRHSYETVQHLYSTYIKITYRTTRNSCTRHILLNRGTNITPVKLLCPTLL